MNRTILYYPTIDIPTNSWLRNALLYWDEVSSIVPKSWDEKLLMELSPDIQYLMDEGQFRPIKPEDLISKSDRWEVFEEFQNEFKEIVSSGEFRSWILTRNRILNRIKTGVNSDSIIVESRIHSNKTSDIIFNFLEERGLAKRARYDEWIYFESTTAFLYMSLLAKYLADIDSEQTTIGTDKAIYESFNFKKVKGDDGGFPVVSFNISNVLPTPKDSVPFEKIVKFKKNRTDNLRHFKKSLSDFQTKISNSESYSEIKENAMNFQETLTNGVEDLNAVLKDGRIDCKIKSLKSLISLKSPTFLAASASVANQKFDLIDIPIDLNMAGIALAGMIELSTHYIDGRNKERAKLRESPFSYIYHAQRKGIISTKK